MLIGLTGAAGAGKDTVADYLRFTFDFRRQSFAEPMRRMLYVGFGLTSEHFDRSLKEAPLPWLGVSPRRLMQTLGTEWGRQLIADDVWLRLAERELEAHAGRRTVITDVRFDNEAAFIKERGGILWRVVRPGVAAVAAHVSEAGVGERFIDHSIFNVGTIADLERRVDELARAVLLQRKVAA